MSDINEKIKDIINKNNVVLFMKGTPEMPQCGFSMTVSNILKELKALRAIASSHAPASAASDHDPDFDAQQNPMYLHRVFGQGQASQTLAYLGRASAAQDRPVTRQHRRLAAANH